MSLTSLTKNAITLNPYIKAGSGWDYDQVDFTYDGEFDEHGRRVLYDSIGTAATMSGLAKSSAVSLSTLTKNAA